MNTHPDWYDLTGKSFGRLTVLGPLNRYTKGNENKSGSQYWKCKCICGNEVEVFRANLLALHSTQCRPCADKIRNYVHGLTKHSLFSVWCGIIARTTSTHNSGFIKYGGRGIKIQSSWADDPEKFIQDVEIEIGPRPSPSHQLDRVDNDGNYETGNIRWSTPGENANNQWREAYKSEIEDLFLRSANKHKDITRDVVWKAFKGHAHPMFSNYGRVLGLKAEVYGHNTRINGVSLRVSRCIYALFTDADHYVNTILHLNGCIDDNRIWNLVEGTNKEKQHNKAYNYERKLNHEGKHLWWLSEQDRCNLLTVEL